MKLTNLTPWGYMTAEVVPPLMTPEQVSDATGGAVSADDPRVEPIVASVSAAVRNYCGWHVSSSIECQYIAEPIHGLVVLPASVVSEVSEVLTGITTYGDSLGGTPVDMSKVVWLPDGRVYMPCDSGRLVAVTYTAGIADKMSSLYAVVSQITSNALVATAGVSREQAGQVSITYNATASGVSGGVTLMERDRMLLEPYRLHNIS